VTRGDSRKATWTDDLLAAKPGAAVLCFPSLSANERAGQPASRAAEQIPGDADENRHYESYSRMYTNVHRVMPHIKI